MLQLSNRPGDGVRTAPIGRVPSLRTNWDSRLPGLALGKEVRGSHGEDLGQRVLGPCDNDSRGPGLDHAAGDNSADGAGSHANADRAADQGVCDPANEPAAPEGSDWCTHRRGVEHRGCQSGCRWAAKLCRNWSVGDIFCKPAEGRAKGAGAKPKGGWGRVQISEWGYFRCVSTIVLC